MAREALEAPLRSIRSNISAFRLHLVPSTRTAAMCISPVDQCPLLVVVGDGDHNASRPLLCGDSYGLDEPSLGGGTEELPLVQQPSETTTHPSSSPYLEVVEEIKALSRISAPAMATGLLFYIRNLVSTLFLGHLGPLELAAGSLSIGFANITGNSVLFGLAMAMDPICSQAYGAHRWTLLSVTLHKTIIILLLTCLPVSLLWLNVDRILLNMGQDPTITQMTKTYLLYSLPDLIAQSFLHPLRIFLRNQNIIYPVGICLAFTSLIHIPLTYYLAVILGTGIKGVATAVAVNDFSVVLLLICYICHSGECSRTCTWPSRDCLKEWGSFFKLAIPSCISVCLEWWWYEFMIILCGLLKKPEETVSAIGILMQLTALVYVFPSSLSYGVSTRVGHEIGAGRPERARKAALVGTTCGAMVGVVAMAFNAWARRWWGSMFTNNGGVLQLVSAALPIVGLCELGNCPQTAMCGILRGCARPNAGAHVNVVGFYGVGLPVALASCFGIGLGFVGLWLGLLAAQATCAVVLGVVLVMTDWAKQTRRAEELTSGHVV